MRARSVCGLTRSNAAAPARPLDATAGRGQRRADVARHGLVQGHDTGRGAADGSRRRSAARRPHGRGGEAERLGHLQRLAAAEDDGPVDHRAEFAHVAGPGIGREQREVRRAWPAAGAGRSGATRAAPASRPWPGCPRCARAAAAGPAGRRPGGTRDPRGTRPVCTIAGRSACVAAITRTSTGTGSSPPTRDTRPSCSTRSSRTCAAFGNSPISSSSSVPRSERSNQPRRRPVAPVKLPFSWPNSSESTSSGGIAPQFTRVNGPWSRGANARARRGRSPPCRRRSRRAAAPGRSEPATISTRCITPRRPVSAPTTVSSSWSRPSRTSSDWRSASAERCRAFSSRRWRSFSSAAAKGSRSSAQRASRPASERGAWREAGPGARPGRRARPAAAAPGRPRAVPGDHRGSHGGMGRRQDDGIGPPRQPGLEGGHLARRQLHPRAQPVPRRGQRARRRRSRRCGRPVSAAAPGASRSGMRRRPGSRSRAAVNSAMSRLRQASRQIMRRTSRDISRNSVDIHRFIVQHISRPCRGQQLLSVENKSLD